LNWFGVGCGSGCASRERDKRHRGADQDTIFDNSENNEDISLHRIHNANPTSTFFGTMKLLLASADMDLARALSAALFSHGITLEHCTDPIDVQGRSWRSLPDLILVDLDLPLASGFTLLRRLQDDSFCRDIPVIVTSEEFDHLSEEVELCWRHLGTEGFLPRPFSMLEIPALFLDIATSGWSIDGDEPFPNLEGMPAQEELESTASSLAESGPVSLSRLRNRRRDARKTHRDQSLSDSAMVRERVPKRGAVTAFDLHREIDDLQLAPPRRVLGLGARAPRQEIRSAALKKRDRLMNLRDDSALVPQVRVAAQRLLEVVVSAEACLLGRLY
jgi:CheY-like chemotaxis protein